MYNWISTSISEYSYTVNSPLNHKCAIMKIIFIISLFFLMSCKTVGEYIEYQKSKPKFEEVFLPFSGELNINHREHISASCSLAASLYVDEVKRLKTTSTYKCRTDDLFGGNNTTKCREVTNPGYLRAGEARAIRKKYMDSCMAKNGYKRVEVCIQNCNNNSVNSSDNQNLNFNTTKSSERFVFLLSEKEYQSLSTELLPLVEKAKNGNLKAQYNLGLSFVKGNGAVLNKDLGIQLLEASAERDYFKSQYALGTIYEKDKSYQKAFDWYKRSADLGYLESQFRYGLFNWKGKEKGVARDWNEAYFWMKKAASTGHTRSQYYMGVIYLEKGWHLKSYTWLHIAEINGLTEPSIKLKSRIVDDLTQKQIIEAEKIGKQCIDSSYKECG